MIIPKTISSVCTNENEENYKITRSVSENRLLALIKDKIGKEYVCYSRDVKKSKFFEDLSKKQKELFDDTNQLVFTETW